MNDQQRRRARKGCPRGPLGTAEIIGKAPRWAIHPEQSFTINHLIRERPGLDLVPFVSEEEAKEDGFEDQIGFVGWIGQSYKGREFEEPMNRLVLKWHQKLYWSDRQLMDLKREWAALNTSNSEVVTQHSLELLFERVGGNLPPRVEIVSGPICPTLWGKELLERSGVWK